MIPSVTEEAGPFYRPHSTMLDEALLPDGSFHPDWEPWSQVSQEEGSETIHTWEKVVRRLEREMGLTHFQDSTATSLNSPWSVDSVPWILGSDDWALIEKGLEQRVRLMKAIQQDLEGACRLLSERVLPPEIVFLHRGYLPQLHGLEPSPTLNAFDLARGPDGKMWVISHRHDITSGLGFALKNRSILSRALSTPFQRCRVRRLADFFRSWRDTLESCSSRTPRNCRVVFLSSEQRRVKAEDFFLANYLGYTLALPGDLTVRDRQVWLRSLGGLQRVDVLWRTVIGRDLDPLEIAPQPCDEWGLPALFSAIRANQVQVVNPPGSGVLESPAFVPFYRAICQKLLDEDLLLPSAATWWCGEPKALDHVLSNLSTLVIKSAVSRWDNRRQYGAKLSAGELSTLRQQILADPAAYVGQEEVHLSTTPSYRGGALHPAPSGLRTFAHSDLFGNVHVMPGGLGSVISSDGERERECTKDVWVRAEGPLPPHHSLWPSASDESAKTTTSFHIPSRTGENLFWTGRYAERADATVRFLRSLLARRIEGLDQPLEVESRQEIRLLHSFLELLSLYPLHTPPNPQQELESLLQDAGRVGSLTSALRTFHHAAYEIRDVWSSISLQAIDACLTGWEDATQTAVSAFDYYSPLDRLSLDLTAFLGLSLESMTRDAGWCLLDAGRRIERALLLVGLLEKELGRAAPEDIQSLLYEAILSISDSLVTYRRRYRQPLRPELMLDLLIKVPNHPRSLAYQVDRLQRVLPELPEKPGLRLGRGKILQMVGDLAIKLRQADITQLAQLDPSMEERTHLIQFLQSIRETLWALSDELTIRYFSHAGKSR